MNQLAAESPRPERAGPAPETTRDRPTGPSDLAVLALSHERFAAAATAAATELCVRLACERVSIGLMRRGRVRVEALSHSATFDARSGLVRDLAAAMEEACDQDAAVAVPAPRGGTPRITLAHERLARQHGAASVCTLPLASQGRPVGAVTFEWTGAAGFDPETQRLCQDLLALLGPILHLQFSRDARPLERVRNFCHLHASRLLGPDRPTLKLAAIGAAGLVLFLALARGDHRVTADATLEGRVQRAVVAGLDGYIAEASARAGDVVRQGQVLGRLEDKDLVLERRKWSAKRAQFGKEYREALAAHDRAEARILSARAEQAEAELALLDEQLARTHLLAPFDGVVVEGDLSQSLGSPVERGQVLFEIAPLDGYRIILEVDERDIVAVAAGAPGHLVLSALPQAPLALTVERVTPVATAEDGRNFFRVEARLDEPADSLRPGMQGIAKIEAGRRALFWIWSHGLFDWLRIRAWSWWP